MKINLTLILITVLLFGCNDKDVKTEPYSIVKDFKNDIVTKYYVSVQHRLSKQQLIGISCKIKSDSSVNTNLQINYLLPGNQLNTVGSNDAYAIALYPNEQKNSKEYPLKDTNGDHLSLDILGIEVSTAKKLLSQNPPNLISKLVVGKFINDYKKTVTVIFKERAKSNDLYMLELDTAGKVVSAIVPLIEKMADGDKMVISKKGDFSVLNGDTLKMYSYDETTHPFLSIKSGI